MTRIPFRTLSLLLVASSLIAAPADAASGTWNTNPANGDWHVPSNWSSMAVPNGAVDIATFGLSTITSVFLSANTEADSIVFNAGASAYTITANPARALTIRGAGIVNNSGINQTLVAGVNSSGSVGSITFTNRATVGSSTSLISSGSLARNTDGGTISFWNASSAGEGILTAAGSPVDAGRGGNINFFGDSSAARATLTANPGALSGGHWGEIHFYNSSTAAHATIATRGGLFGTPFDAGGRLVFHNNASAEQAVITNGSGNAPGAGGAGTGFRDRSTASTATIINHGGSTDLSYGGGVGFDGNATAGNSLIINNGGMVQTSTGGSTVFLGSSSAGSATLIANAGKGEGPLGGGEISFDENSTGGTARIQVFGNGFLDIRQHTAPGVTIGSLEGTGLVYVGGNNLSIGSNNLSTEFTGVIKYGGPFGPDPTGGSITKIGSGTLTLSGHSTYTGQTVLNAGKLIINGSVLTPLLVDGGTLSGTGTIGTTTINGGGTLAPGSSVGILRVDGALTLTLGATYLIELNGPTVGTQHDQTAVTGAVVLGDATLSLRLGFQPEPGMMFTIIENGGTDGVSGIFAGLSEGMTVAADGQGFSISYAGGSGNDVVLTAIIPEPRTWLLLAMGLLLSARVCR